MLLDIPIPQVSLSEFIDDEDDEFRSNISARSGAASVSEPTDDPSSIFIDTEFSIHELNELQSSST